MTLNRLMAGLIVTLLALLFLSTPALSTSVSSCGDDPLFEFYFFSLERLETEDGDFFPNERIFDIFLDGPSIPIRDSFTIRFSGVGDQASLTPHVLQQQFPFTQNCTLTTEANGTKPVAHAISPDGSSIVFSLGSSTLQPNSEGNLLRCAQVWLDYNRDTRFIGKWLQAQFVYKNHGYDSDQLVPIDDSDRFAASMDITMTRMGGRSNQRDFQIHLGELHQGMDSMYEFKILSSHPEVLVQHSEDGQIICYWNRYHLILARWASSPAAEHTLELDFHMYPVPFGTEVTITCDLSLHFDFSTAKGLALTARLSESLGTQTWLTSILDPVDDDKKRKLKAVSPPTTRPTTKPVF